MQRSEAVACAFSRPSAAARGPATRSKRSALVKAVQNRSGTYLNVTSAVLERPILRLGSLTFAARNVLVANLLQQVADHVQAHAPLVLRACNEPRRFSGIGGGEHVIARLRVVVPAIIGFHVHRRELPRLAAVTDPVCEPPCLLLGAHLQPVLQQDDSRS